MRSSRKAITFLQQEKNLRRVFSRADIDARKRTSRATLYNILNSSRSVEFFSTAAVPFQPPEPNTYNAPAVYENIDIIANNGATHTSATVRKNDPDAVYVITGASRGMGLQYVKSLLLDPSRAHPCSKIIACCRSPKSATALNEFIQSLGQEDRDRIHVQQLDVTSDDNVASLATYIKDTTNRVDILFNVAGVLGDSKNTPGPERNIKQFDREWFRSQMDINAIGPMMVTKALAPFLKVSKKDLKSEKRAESIVVNMSARVGSIGDNMGGLGWHSYRMSKAALNMGTRALAHELGRGGTLTIALYPGFTDTDMSKPFQMPGMKEKGMVFPVSFTVGRMLDVVEGMEKKHSGGIYDWSGIALPF